MNITPERARELRRRHRHERQAVIFGGLVAAMAVTALGATAVYTGVVDAPFTREFTTIAPETPVPTAVAQPCVPAETLPVPYSEVQVRVLNGTDRAGLAGDTAQELTARGFTVLGTANSPTPLATTATVHVGQAGLAHGYTLAAQIEGAMIELDTREDATVDLVLGDEWTEMIDPGVVPLDAAEPLTPVSGCVPLEEALEAAGPPPAIGGEEDPAPENADETSEQAPDA